MKNLIFFLSFFIYSGYYAGLAIILSLNLADLSRFYSLPIRILLALLMIFVIQKNRKALVVHKFSKYLVLFIIFWTFYVLKVLYTENLSYNNLSKDWYEFIFYALTYVILPFITFFTLDFEKYKKVILDGLIFSGFVMGSVSAYLYGDLLAKGVGRISLITYETGEHVLNPLALSYAGVLTIVLCMYRLIILKEKRKYQVIYLLSTIVLSFAMFLLGSSRGSVIALMLTIPLFILYSPIKRKIWLTSLIVLLIPVVIWAIEASGSNLFYRIGRTSKDRGGGRELLWENAIAHFMEYPIFGGKIEIGGIYPHNLIVEILMATGVVGALLILPVIFKGFKLGITNTRRDKMTLFVLLMMIQGLVQHLFTGGIYFATLLFVPLSIAMSKQDKQV